MKKIILLSLLLSASFLFSCKEKVKEEPISEPEEVVTLEEVVEESVTVSSFATCNYLEPLEEYSWQREYPVEYVMLHFTSAVVLDKSDPYNIASVRKIFEDANISINYIIDRDGNISCYIPEDRCAWHAGKGSFKDIEKLTDAMNKYSIGIEIVAVGSEKDMAPYFTKSEYATINKELIGFTDAQYQALIPLLKDICQRNDIPYDREHVIGHQEYKEAKTDPGELFEWERLFE